MAWGPGLLAMHFVEGHSPTSYAAAALGARGERETSEGWNVTAVGSLRIIGRGRDFGVTTRSSRSNCVSADFAQLPEDQAKGNLKQAGKKVKDAFKD
jgi:hypothetical protein